MPNYWVVGAMFGGNDDQSDKFIRRGYWFLGWDANDQPGQAKLRDQIQKGDRIAIKKMLGQGSPHVEIRALGEVKEIDEEHKRVYIDWFVKDLKREVPSRGAYKSIHGPFQESDDWVKEVFIYKWSSAHTLIVCNPISNSFTQSYPRKEDCFILGLQPWTRPSNSTKRGA